MTTEQPTAQAAAEFAEKVGLHLEPWQIDVLRLSMRQDDVLCVRANREALTSEYAASVWQGFKSVLPNNDVVVVPAGFDLTVVGPVDERLSAMDALRRGETPDPGTAP